MRDAAGRSRVRLRQMRHDIQSPLRWSRVEANLQTFNTHWSPRQSFPLAHCDDIVAVLPWYRTANQLILLRQFRPAALALSCDPPAEQLWQTEVVAGNLEAETPFEAACRELGEETKLHPLMLFPLPVVFANPALLTARIHPFIAEVDGSSLCVHCGRPDEGEDIQVCRVPVADALLAALDGGFHNALTVLMVTHFALWLSRQGDTHAITDAEGERAIPQARLPAAQNGDFTDKDRRPAR